MATTQNHQLHPLCRFAALPPKGAARARSTTPRGGSKEPLRIRLGAFQMVFCIPRLTPPARCAVLSFALSSCTPSGTATPAKPFRGGWTRLPDGGAGRLDGTSEPARLTEGVWLVEWKQLKNTNATPFAAARHFPQRGQQGSLRIRLGAFRMVFCVPRLTPPARCAASPFRGG